MTETYAGRLARTLPELGARELGCLASENYWHENTGPTIAVRWVAEWRDGAERTIRDRAEDAAGMAWAKLQAVPLATFERGTAGLVWSCAYWAALP